MSKHSGYNAGVATAKFTAAETKHICADQCGAKCCRGLISPLYVVLSKAEEYRLKKIAKARDLPLTIETGPTGEGRSMVLKPGSACSFLDQETNLCSIHDQRPNACMTYPMAPNMPGCLLSGWKPPAKKPTVFVGVPRGAFPRSLVFEDKLRQITGHLTAKGMYAGWFERSTCRVDNNRNAIVRQFLASDGDFLLMLDDDMDFEVQTAEVLANRLWAMRKENPRVGVIGGLYFQRAHHCLPHSYSFTNVVTGELMEPIEKNGEYAMQHDWVLDPILKFFTKYGQHLTDGPWICPDPKTPTLVKVDALGTGCVMIARDCLEDVGGPWFRVMGRTFEEPGGTGGDHAFFHKIKDKGWETVLDIGVVCAHYGYDPVGVRTFLSSMAETGAVFRKVKSEAPVNDMRLVDVILITDDEQRAGAYAFEWRVELGPFLRTTVISGGPYDQGWTRKVNTGLMSARARYALVLNDDVRLPAGTVQRWIGLMEQNEKLAALGPTISCRSHQQFRVAEPDVIDVPWIIGGAQLIRVEAQDQSGLLDEAFHSYGSDVDMCLRLRANGWQVMWDQTVEAEHELGAGTGESWKADHTRLMEIHRDRQDQIAFVPEGIVESICEAVPMDSVAENGSQPEDLDLDHPWNIQEAAFAEIVRRGKEVEPKRILEFGSGKSTVRLCQAFPNAMVHAIEHNPEYAEQVWDLAERYEVCITRSSSVRIGPYIMVVPLKPNGGGYVLDHPALLSEYDMIIVDGPPSTVNQGRLEALRWASDHVRIGGVIIMDDIKRPDVREATQVQFEEHGPAFSYEQVAVGHGLGILTRTEPTGAEHLTKPGQRAVAG